MTPPEAQPPEIPLSSPEARAELDRLLSSAAFSAPGRGRDLLQYLVSRSLRGEVPKEIEIAADVFHRQDPAGAREDATARVYVHRLRKRLEDFYLRTPSPGGLQILIPLGEYRLTCTSSAPAYPPAPSAPGRTGGARVRVWLAVIALCLASGGIGALTAMIAKPSNAALTSAEPWRSLLRTERPLKIATGGYYIFGDYEDGLFLRRLVRDFAVNSKDDLLRAQASQPEAYGGYSDVSLHYLPTSAGEAIASLAPVISQSGNLSVSIAPDLPADILRTHDLLYVGLISGLGPLRSTVFRASRFRVGESYDHIQDAQTGQRYVSEAFEASIEDRIYRDYALVAAFAGPAGGRVVILAGARDSGLAGAAEQLAKPDFLEQLAVAAGGARDFEALLEITGEKGISLETRILAASPLDSAAIWSGPGDTPSFPSE